MSARLFILVQIFLDELLVRLERSVRVSPEMETKCTDSTQNRHDCSHQNPDGDGDMLGRFRILVPETNGTGQGLRDGRAEKNREKDKQFRLHVMRPRLLHFLPKPNAVNEKANAATNDQIAPAR